MKHLKSVSKAVTIDTAQVISLVASLYSIIEQFVTGVKEGIDG